MPNSNDNGDVLDSQFLSENVGFLESCFDSSFDVFQTTLNTVKEYLNEENLTIPRSNLRNINKNDSLLHKTINNSFKNEDKKSYNKTQSLANVNSCEVENNTLYHWGLPEEITKRYEVRGIVKMFDWQVACLSNPKVIMDCCNLVYSAPTSAGKTLVAEIIAIKTILERQKKVMIILPFVSIVREKMFYLQDILSLSGIRIEGFMGSQSPPGGLSAVHVAICTIEKANNLINRMLDDGSISDLGAVIVDELHLLGDPHRGYILELLLTKIKYISTKIDDSVIQIIGMSATLPNLEILAKWLDAELFITEFRPIPLDEYCLVGTTYYNKYGENVGTLNQEVTTDIMDSDCVVKICLETIRDGCSILIFCMTKNRCENLAQNISSTFYKIGCSGNEMGNTLRNQLNTNKILEVLEQLKNCPVGLDNILKSTISFGVAYHHAGLTFDERDIIEGGFKSGAIRVLIATSTLSSGVNLPARKVIIRTPVFQRQPINILTYKQMIGRAGRMGKDTKGESILLCTEAEKRAGLELMIGVLPPVKSCIDSEDKFMRAVLEMIASQIVCSGSDLENYSKCTLLFNQKDNLESHCNLLNKTLNDLINFELIRIQVKAEEMQYIATPLGKACLSSSMTPNDGLSLFCELQKARQCLVLETDLHLIYLVTPYSVSNQWGEIDWLHLLSLWESLTKSMKRVGELVGVQESFIIRSLRGGHKQSNNQNKVNIHKRFYTALALQDLVNEVPLSDVAVKFQCARGFLQSLQQAAATFAGMVTAFCHQLGWKNIELLISQFQDRLHFGIHSELLELMKLPSLNGVRARSLFDSGFQTVSSIASGDVNKIENALYKSVPFQSEKGKDDEETKDIMKHNKIKNIWVSGCCAMTVQQAAKTIITEARKCLEYEIGVSEIKWDKEKSNIDVNQILHTSNISTPISGQCFDYPDVKNDILNEDIKNKSRNIENQNFDVHKKNNTDNDRSKKFLVGDNVSSQLRKENNETKNHKEVDIINPPLKDITAITNQNIKTNKEDIVWDSLNFTDIHVDNVTRVGTSDNVFSPNISFGESDDKVSQKDDLNNISSKLTSKDISLFSSDGDDSSIFEDSLLLGLIPSKLLNIDDNNKLQITNLKESTQNTSVTNTILQEFKSTCVEFDEEEDIKLFYEEDNKLAVNTCAIKFNSTIDIEEINTQERNKISSRPNYISPFKRHIINDSHEDENIQPLKKAKQACTLTLSNRSNLKIALPVLKKLSSQQAKLKIQNFDILCFILREEDIINNFNIFDNCNDVALYLDVKNKLLPSNKIIGGNIFKSSKCNERETNGIVADNLCGIKSITFSYLHICILFDFTSLSSNDIPLVKQKLHKLFKRSEIKWKYLSLQSMFGALTSFCDLIPVPWIEISLVEWLIDSDEKTRNLSYLVKKYLYIDLSTVSILVDDKEKKFKNLESNKDLCLRTWLIWNVAEKINIVLNKQYSSIKNTLDIEMQTLKILSHSQYSGITVNKSLASELLVDVKNCQDTLQKKAFKICGYHFNFNSSKDVAKVLGIYKGRKVSTKKSVLTAHNTAMSSIIIYWRKLNSILTKTLYPLTEKACIYSDSDRINPTYTMYTCTGRVNMHEPNLQNVPRTFNIPAKYLSANENEVTDDVVEFNCRNIFQAAHGNILVSADYCQLEMRILTHYSRDPTLTKIMSSDVDVFKSIAASWGGVPEDEVDDDLRQKAKQLCYGILYGMGNKTLAQTLDVTEVEAAVFMDTFFKTYPTIKSFTQVVIDDCKKNGYVETLKKRRRYLPDINSSILSKKSAAERQAVNTTIQGSAADIAKAAMCAIDDRTKDDLHKTQLFLQMHDELIYEVPLPYKHTFISIMKEVMEQTVRLNVPLPVKIKTGFTWGALEEIKI